MRREFKICIAGHVMSGRATTIRLMHAYSPEIVATPPPRQPGGVHRFVWRTCATDVEIALTYVYQHCRKVHVLTPDLRMPHEEPRLEEERNALLGCDGLFFVMDTQTAIVNATVDLVRWLREALEAAGRDLTALPVVFMLNKRDLRRVERLDVLRTKLVWPLCDHVVSAASLGLGVHDALARLVELVEQTQHSR